VIFAARDLLVSFAFFATVYCPLSLLVGLAWRIIPDPYRKSLASVNFLFGLRIFPLTLSALITLFFTVPSFWLLERTTLDEDGATFILALCAVVILSAGLFRVLKIQARTAHAVSQWLMASPSLAGDASTPALSASNGAPALVLIGIRNPRVMVSDVAASVLTNNELQVAVRHELAHQSAWDNAKKVLITATPFPGMGSIECAWLEAAEIAADDAAVATRQEALDLAAALIKLSRSSEQWIQPLLATGLVSGSSSIGPRVERLLEWRIATPRFQPTRGWTVFFWLAMTIGVALNYIPMLVLTHRLTEILVP
jgi:Zn-dependent protease with chaperone function